MAARRDKSKRRSKQNAASGPSSSSTESKSRENKTADPKPPSGDLEPNPTPAEKVTSTVATTINLPPLSRILSIVMLILGIVVVGALFFQVMVRFFVPLFLAACLVVIFRPIHKWIFAKVGCRRRLAALTTTSLVLLVVLVPVIFVMSIAASQLTSAISHLDLTQLTESLDSARNRFGLTLIHPEKFRRLEQLADRLDRPDQSENEWSGAASMNPVVGPNGNPRLISQIEEAQMLVLYLDQELVSEGMLTAEIAEESDDLTESKEGTSLSTEESPNEPIALSREGRQAMERLESFGKAAQVQDNRQNLDLLDRITVEEERHRQSVIASAAIRSWMRRGLGGTLRSQFRLLANPSAEDVKDLLNRARESLQPRFVSLTSRTGSYLIQWILGLVVLVISVYFFLVDGTKMTKTLMRLSPLDDAYEEQLLQEFDRTSRAVVLASLAAAVVQGGLAAIAFWMVGLENVILLFLLTTLLALIPFLGAGSVWVPVVIYLFAVEERVGAAIGLTLFGAGVISTIDNLIKMYVLQGRSTLHPLLALLSVLGGVMVFGPIGIIVGPMVVVFLQTLLEILNHEIVHDQLERDLKPSMIPIQGGVPIENDPSGASEKID